MSIATLLHNPKAGEESYTEKELISLIEKEGIELIYSSIKEKGWDKFDPRTNFLIVAGGDGTVRNVSKKLIKDNLNRKYPIALLPAGTANNIAKTLDIPEKDEEVIQSWKKNETKHFDFGRVKELGESHIFLESFGFGVFPVLMEVMKKQDEDLVNTPEKKIKLALELLIGITNSFKPFGCQLEVDGARYDGEFLLVEIMNTQSIGPNLVLSPNSDPGDGELEVVLIRESQKEQLLDYINKKLLGVEKQDNFDIIKVKNVKIKCDNYLAHFDDELFKIEGAPEVVVELDKGGLEFLI